MRASDAVHATASAVCACPLHPKTDAGEYCTYPTQKKSEARVQSEFSYLPGSNAMQALVAAQFEFLRFVSPGSEHAAAVSSVKRLKVNLPVHSMWFDIVCK